MTSSAVKAYKWKLKKQLSPELCSRRVRGLLLSRFDTMLDTMAEEYPNPNPAQLEQAFGTPAQMAETLLDGIPQEKRIRRQSSMRTLRKLLVAALILALAGGLIYVWWFKSFAIHAKEAILVFQ